MAAVSNQNIKSAFCPCVIVQGVKCPAGRRGKVCNRAHTIDEIQPKPCTREKEGEGCFCRDKPWPLVCVFIHEGESVKDDYPKRLGFDPEHKAFDNKTWSELNRLSNECYEHKKYFQDSLAEHIGSIHHSRELTEQEFLDVIPEVIQTIESYDTTTVRASVGKEDIPEEDLDYVKMTRSIVYLLNRKEEFLTEKTWQAENCAIQDDIPREGEGDRYFRTPEEKVKNREKVRAKFKKGKYVRVHEVFEDENDEECYEEYREMMEQDDMEGSYADMQLAIVNDWVDQTIERWDREDKGEKFEDLHLKDAWGDYRDFDRQKAAWEDRHDKWEEQLRERGDSE